MNSQLVYFLFAYFRFFTSCLLDSFVCACLCGCCAHSTHAPHVDHVPHVVSNRQIKKQNMCAWGEGRLIMKVEASLRTSKYDELTKTKSDVNT